MADKKRTQQWWMKLALGAVFAFLIGLFLAPYFAGIAQPNPVLWQVGPWSLYWYGVLMALSVVVCAWIVWRYRHRTSLNDDQLIMLLAWTVIGGIIGARLLYVLLKLPLYVSDPLEIIMVQHGGLSIHGALLGGAIALWIAVPKPRSNFWSTADLIALTLPIGQAIGRFGNFFNQEAFGGPTNLPWKMYVEPTFRPEGLMETQYFHPTFLYEAVCNVLIFAWLLRRYPASKRGETLIWYLLLYSGLRFITEFFRIDADLWWHLTIAQWASLAIILIGLYWWRKKLWVSN